MKAALIVLLTVWAASAAHAQTLHRSVIGCGGSSMGAGSTVLRGTAGQSWIGTVSGGPLTHEAGYWHGNPVLQTGVAGPGLTPALRLLQNVPNPFRGSTRIAFELARAQEVELLVLDVQGRVVARPVGGRLEAGAHEIEFSALGMSSGVYYYRLRTNDGVRSRSMVLVH